MTTVPPSFPPPEPEPPRTPAAATDSTTHWSTESASQSTWSAGRKWALGLGIAAAGSGLVAAVIAASLAVSGLASAWAESSGFIEEEYSAPRSAPLFEGAPGEPVVRVETDCDGVCFGVFHLDSAQIDEADFERLGTPELFEPQGTYGVVDSAIEHEFVLETWRDQRGSPDECFFTYSNAALSYGVDELPAGDDAIYSLSSFTSDDGYSSIGRTVRFFPSSEAAGEHLQRVHALVPECTRYRVGSGVDTWAANVSPMPALDVPDTVAAVGWVESGAFAGRFYGLDLLRGNAVIRTTLYTDGAVTEEAFREFGEVVARNLASWIPDQ